VRVTATLALLLTSPFVAHARDSGDYAIYSVVLDHLHLTHAGPLRFAIVRETISAPVLPCPAAKGIVQSAAPNQQRLEPGKLSIKEPYKLITENEAAEWIRNRFAPQVPRILPARSRLIRIPDPRISFALHSPSTTPGTCQSAGWKILTRSNTSTLVS
jgi:hypothetical protein